MLTVKKGMIIAAIAALAVTTACGGKDATKPTDGGKQGSTPPAAQAPAAPAKKLGGTIQVDGSSTVFPLSEAVSEEFGKVHKEVRVPVGVSGTGGGFKRFCAGETAISNASRPIKAEEAQACKDKNIEYVELAVAFDGLSVIVSKNNTWVDKLSVAELNKIFEPNSKVVNWSDVRAEWPKEKIKIYSPGADSGTFDYFTEAVNKKAQASRNDSQVTFSEDDNVLVNGVAGDKNSIGYFGFAYYEHNASKLKLVPIVNKDGNAVLPAEKTINDGTYNPLSRPLFIYVNKKDLAREEVKEYVTFYLKNAGKLAKQVGYINLPQKMYDDGLAKLN
ncbi:PstS family phosphate ABC transporter substrate-binding protein [Cohnella sp.]|uniref:PstS family phosphate ABC transporter substrate-binding protein n=1 Tax=Cohnella sp. TaxID=1883426 RepID=UPI003564E488